MHLRDERGEESKIEWCKRCQRIQHFKADVSLKIKEPNDQFKGFLEEA